MGRGARGGETPRRPGDVGEGAQSPVRRVHALTVQALGGLSRGEEKAQRKAEANNLVVTEFRALTGPMPVRIMAAFSSESTQVKPATK